MRYAFWIGAIVSAWPCLSGANVRECQSYLLAPKGYKVHTRELLNASRPEQVQERQRGLAVLANTAAVGDPKIVAYLTALRRDSVLDSADEGLTSLSKLLLAMYLVRPGNESLSLSSLDDLLEGYWEEFAWGPDSIHELAGVEHGTDWTEKQTQFIERVARSYPQAVREAWNRQLVKFLPSLVNMPAVLKSFAAAEEYLHQYVQQPDAEILEDDELFENRDNTDGVLVGRERLNYVRDLTAEIDSPLNVCNVTALLKTYKIGTPPFSGNWTFTHDEEEWRARDNEFASPAQTLAYLVRLSRRLGFSPPEFQVLESSMDRIKRLLPGYPRPARGGGRDRGYAAAGRR